MCLELAIQPFRCIILYHLLSSFAWMDMATVLIIMVEVGDKADDCRLKPPMRMFFVSFPLQLGHLRYGILHIV